MNNESLKSINDKLFITNEMNKQKTIYRWSPPTELITQFGVEFECCIKISPDCINFNTNLLNVLPRDFSVKDKFEFYYKNIIRKSPQFTKLAEKYEYLVVIDKDKKDTQLFYYDMSYPELPGMTQTELLKWMYKKQGVNESNIWSVYHQYPVEAVDKIVEKAKNYQLPIFTDDKSIRCGDTRGLSEKEGAGILDVNSFRFECITPILSIKGKPTKEKIKKELYPMMSLFGLDKPNCFIVNFSMGFHVNVSLYNFDRQQYVAIAEPPFINQLLRNYIKVEKLIYSNVRKRKPVGKENQNYFTEFARPLHKNLNKFKVENPTLSENEIIDTLMTKQNYMIEKYKGIKRKTPFLLEFRLFEGDSDINRLTTHVFVALDILHKTAKEVADKQVLKLVENKPNNYYNVNESNTDSIRYYSNNNNRGGYRKTIKRKRHNKRKTISK